MGFSFKRKRGIGSELWEGKITLVGGVERFLPEVALSILLFAYCMLRAVTDTEHSYLQLWQDHANKASLSSLSHTHAYSQTNGGPILSTCLSTPVRQDEMDWTISEPIRWILQLEQYVIRPRIPVSFFLLIFWMMDGLRDQDKEFFAAIM